ncbi:hypothetical protein F5B21DRAFT_54088 [Xylaria acuta]|nr:hypothetical protein F5B21DRAFT_54088 [Xylaria acuta]
MSCLFMGPSGCLLPVMVGAVYAARSSGEVGSVVPRPELFGRRHSAPDLGPLWRCKKKPGLTSLAWQLCQCELFCAETTAYWAGDEKSAASRRNTNGSRAGFRCVPVFRHSHSQ